MKSLHHVNQTPALSLRFITFVGIIVVVITMLYIGVLFTTTPSQSASANKQPSADQSNRPIVAAEKVQSDNQTSGSIQAPPVASSPVAEGQADPQINTGESQSNPTPPEPTSAPEQQAPGTADKPGRDKNPPKTKLVDFDRKGITSELLESILHL